MSITGWAVLAPHPTRIVSLHSEQDDAVAETVGKLLLCRCGPTPWPYSWPHTAAEHEALESVPGPDCGARAWNLVKMVGPDLWQPVRPFDENDLRYACGLVAKPIRFEARP